MHFGPGDHYRLVTQGTGSIPTLLGEMSRLVVMAGLLWGSGDLALLLIDMGHDIRATRILLGRQALHQTGSTGIHPVRALRELRVEASVERGPVRLLYTIGHSPRSLGSFSGCWQERRRDNIWSHVRAFPTHPGATTRSSRPDLERAVIATPAAQILPSAPSLGGRRRGRRDSHNTLWRNASFRAYADYMEDREEFQREARDLLALARLEPTAIMARARRCRGAATARSSPMRPSRAAACQSAHSRFRD